MRKIHAVAIFIGLYFGSQNILAMDGFDKFPDRSASKDMDSEDDSKKGADGLAEKEGERAYDDAFRVLSSIINVCKISKLKDGVWRYYLKKDICVQDFEKIKIAFNRIKSEVKKNYLYVSSKNSDEIITILTITLDENFRWYQENLK